RSPGSLRLAGQRPPAGRPQAALRARGARPGVGSARAPDGLPPPHDIRPLLLHGHQVRGRRRGPRVFLAVRLSLRGVHRSDARAVGPRAPASAPAPSRRAPGRTGTRASRASRLKKAPVFLLICDGWGHAAPSPGNAITLARTPIFDRWLAEYPWTLLEASGEAVGLPAGVMGNSEVGHLTLGAGRMVPQDLLRIDLALRDGSFFENPALLSAVTAAKRK